MLMLMLRLSWNLLSASRALLWRAELLDSVLHQLEERLASADLLWWIVWPARAASLCNTGHDMMQEDGYLLWKNQHLSRTHCVNGPSSNHIIALLFLFLFGSPVRFIPRLRERSSDPCMLEKNWKTTKDMACHGGKARSIATSTEEQEGWGGR
ncbi:hypothetical protein LX32DRAFT_367199 [Colletotrichum zoysiae]|uniref:Secreted protein n=1 Tax=Colletotrichum zoysiae TaxID=1216348 RepID=A0AAD9HHM5_9PEZI|nr:hypothetical protein LX32DRAFT_367199 [Colletotrichum zoysiae]